MSFKAARRSTDNDFGETELRRRFDRSPDSLSDGAGDLSDGLSDDEDVLGCPLPSTPEDNDLLEAEVSFSSCLN
jgi:hypothetical protein